MSRSADAEAKIIDAIYRGACDSAELARAIELIAGYFDSPGVVLGEIDQARSDKSIVVGARAIDEHFFRKYQTYEPFDPFPRTMAGMAVGCVATSDQLMTADELRGCVFLHEFLKPHGIDAAMASILLASGGRSAMIGIQHDTKRSVFDADERARLERLSPHLTRALQLRRLFLQSETRGKVMESIIERNETAMIALRGDGPPLFVNGAARALAGAHDGLTLDRHGRLVAADRAAALRLAALQADVARNGAGGLARVPRPSGRQPYVVLVSPLPSADELFPSASGSVLFAIHDPARREAPTERRIAQMLHIPLGAAKVVQAILEGVDLKDYADRAGISMNTVRFHLKTAFARTETRSQAELVRNAMSMLNDIGPYFVDRK